MQKNAAMSITGLETKKVKGGKPLWKETEAIYCSQEKRPGFLMEHLQKNHYTCMEMHYFRLDPE